MKKELFIEIYSVAMKPYLLASIYKRARGKIATKREEPTIIFKHAVFRSAMKIKFLNQLYNFYSSGVTQKEVILP